MDFLFHQVVLKQKKKTSSERKTKAKGKKTKNERLRPTSPPLEILQNVRFAKINLPSFKKNRILLLIKILDFIIPTFTDQAKKTKF